MIFNQSFQSDFDEIWERILKKEPLAFARYADGELALIEGKSVKTIDSWTCPNNITLLGSSLLTTLRHRDESYYYGIPCDCCDPTAKQKFLLLLEQNTKSITFSNLFVNSNYSRFIEKIKHINEEVFLIANENINLNNTNNFICIKEFLPVESDCVKFWESHSSSFLETLRLIASEHHNTLFLIAAGPLSEIIIHHLWLENPSNRYIDIGSSLDEIFYNKKTRSYHDYSSIFSQRSCELKINNESRRQNITYIEKPQPNSVTVIINGYKRPKNLEIIFKALKHQSIPPQSVMIWYNDFFDNLDSMPKYKLSPSLLQESIYSLSNFNFGVWARFAFALNSKSEYVCIFDDDTIPGKRWLENCLETIKAYPGLLGTIGLVYQSASYWDHIRYGWDNPQNETIQVDIVGHSWFFKREWLSALWHEPRLEDSEFSGEDMHFSFALQKYLSINTFVPPHPPDDRTLWGSLKGWKLGSDDVAISRNVEYSSFNKFDRYFKYLISRGWKLLYPKAKWELSNYNLITFPDWSYEYSVLQNQLLLLIDKVNKISSDHESTTLIIYSGNFINEDLSNKITELFLDIQLNEFLSIDFNIYILSDIDLDNYLCLVPYIDSYVIFNPDNNTIDSLLMKSYLKPFSDF